MVRYLLHRLGRTLAVVAGVTLALFVVIELHPGGPEVALCGDAGCPPAMADAVRETFALDAGLADRAAAFGRAAATLDFGPSLTLQRQSLDVLRAGLGSSVRLVSATLLLELVFLAAVALANVAGDRPWLRRASVAFSVGALVVPLFWLGLVTRAIVPSGLLPAAVVLAFAGIGFGIRQVHERVRDGLDAAHVRLARTYGVPERRIVLRHGLRPAVPMALGSLAGSGGVVLAGLLFLEPAFGRDGIGAAVAGAIARQDRPVVLGGAFVLLAAFVVLRTVLLIGARLAEPPRADRWSIT